MGRLAGQTAYITGGGSGIGRACALLFSSEGAAIAVVGRRRERLEAVVREIRSLGGRAVALACDVTEPQQADESVHAAVTAFSELNIVVNSAGASFVGTVEETSDADWQRILDVNLKGTFLVCRAAIPELRRAGRGSIVNIGSVYGLVGRTQRAAYAAAKGGVILLTKAMALDHAAEKIRVNCICPAIVRTELLESIFADAPDAEEALRQRAAQIPLRRAGEPEEVARLALFLASEESSWITGAAIPIDGGFTAH